MPFIQVGRSPDINSHQGVCTDGSNFYTIDTGTIYKWNSEWRPITSNTSAATDAGIAHLGDGTYYNGHIYIAAEDYNGCGPGATINQRISRFLASDLSFVDNHDISAQGHEVSSLCIDAAADRIYVSDYCVGAYIFVYKLSDFTYVGTITLSTPLVNIQGIAKKGNRFYVSRDANNSIYEVAIDGTVGGIVYTSQSPTALLEGIDYTTDYLYVLDDQGANEYVYKLKPSMPRLPVRNYSSALRCTVTGNKCNAGSAASLQITGDLTFSHWLRPEEAGIARGPFSHLLSGETEATNSLYEFRWDTTGKLIVGWEYGGGTNVAVTTTGIYLKPKSWVHYGVVRDTTAKTVKFFINGALVETVAYSDNPTGGTSGILSMGSGATSYVGGISEFCIWNKQRTDVEMRDLYLQGSIPTDGLVLQWMFDEGSGTTAVDKSGSGNTGTITGATYSTDTPMIAPRTALTTPRLAVRNYNAALDSTGSSQYVTLPYIDLGTSLTYAFWIFRKNTTASVNIFAYMKTLLRCNSTSLTWFPDVDSSSVGSSTVSPFLNRWAHVGITQTGTTYAFYVNGVQAGTGTTNAIDNASSAKDFIGHYTSGTDAAAIYSDVVIYNTALTAAQMAGLYYGTEPTGFIERWKLVDGAGTSAAAENGNTGTITGATFTSNTPFKSRKLVNGNMVVNGDQSFVPPFTAATTTSARWVDGTAGGSTTNSLFGWDVLLEFAGAASFDSTNGNALKIATTTNPPSNNHRVSFENTIGITAAILKNQGIPIVSGTQYRVTFEMKTDSVTSTNSRGARCSVLSYSNDATGSTQELNFSYVSGTTAWTTYTGTFTATANRAFLRLLLEIRGEEGTAWFRNITLTPTTPVTRTAVS